MPTVMPAARAGRPSPRPGQPPPGTYPLISPTRVWPAGGELAGLEERLAAHWIIFAHGMLDDEAATRLCAQLLTLDAEGDDPIRLELQGLSSELPAALTVMGILDVVGVPLRGYASGQLGGPALGLLACCTERRGYPGAVFALTEPRAQFTGPAAELAARQEQVGLLTDALFARLAEVTGSEVDDIRADARQGRVLTAEQAVSYGLLHELARPRRLPQPAAGTAPQVMAPVSGRAGRPAGRQARP